MGLDGLGLCAWNHQYDISSPPEDNTRLGSGGHGLRCGHRCSLHRSLIPIATLALTKRIQANHRVCYRLFVQKSAWMQVLAGLAEETDYDNFKSEVADHQGRAGVDYEHSLHEVWSVMHRLQK